MTPVMDGSVSANERRNSWRISAVLGRERDACARADVKDTSPAYTGTCRSRDTALGSHPLLSSMIAAIPGDCAAARTETDDSLMNSREY